MADDQSLDLAEISHQVVAQMVPLAAALGASKKQLWQKSTCLILKDILYTASSLARQRQSSLQRLQETLTMCSTCAPRFQELAPLQDADL